MILLWVSQKTPVNACAEAAATISTTSNGRTGTYFVGQNYREGWLAADAGPGRRYYPVNNQDNRNTCTNRQLYPKNKNNLGNIGYI